MLLQAATLVQPLLTVGTLLEGRFWWMCPSLVPLGGLRSMGLTERPVFACRSTCSSTCTNYGNAACSS